MEFKSCGNGIANDTYETVCSFLNRFGSDIFMVVLDDGTVAGIPEKAALDLVKNFIKVVSQPVLLEPTAYLVPEMIRFNGKTILHVHVSASGEVHKYKNVIYDRVDDADVKVTSTSVIAELYIRKQNIFTEKRIYKYVSEDDLRMGVLAKCRQRAVNRFPIHPWQDLSDRELLRSAGLYGIDRVTGEKGFNLAAVLLLGKDDVFRTVIPLNDSYSADRETVKPSLSVEETQIYSQLRNHPESTHYSRVKIGRILKSLRNRQIIERVGSKKQGTWKILK